METISTYLSSDHRHCDELFAASEEAAAERNWQDAAACLRAFRQAMERHFSMEENVLFPAFEARTGNTMGPTRVMRVEHAQMRELMEEMTQALCDKDTERYLGVSETLLVMMQQHNAKEEQILYPMSDQALGDERRKLLERMAAVQEGDAQAAECAQS